MNNSHLQPANTYKLTPDSCPFPSISDWDQPLTDYELEAIDAIEAAYRLRSTSSTTPSSSDCKRGRVGAVDDTERLKTRRQLPSSVLSLCKPFSLSQCRDNVKMRYPALKFVGRIVYSRTQMEVENTAREILRSFEAREGIVDQVIVGFDIEWKPTFRRGVLPGKVAVIQICADANQCHVLHIIHSGVTESLRFLLEEFMRLKFVGAGIGNDCIKIFKDYNVSVKAVEDLSHLANRKLGGQPKVWGLQSLTERLVCKELLKPNKIRLGNWEVDILSKHQLEYAATDAFASWHLYQVIIIEEHY
ncbi:hypothetical protein K2173_011617 [Erythroxylum novogranatense]|uniref:3'-5' exonuclease n=1 Tax=Erythroxylum novogranatense TaxID=1862640 RepID=A0AAV8U7Q2_9ROSI|nr:hypothetical protein K2173_011617 [Erythroxylum novogranatense]